jgi:NAD(P)-dependent dehydrogenase (short-subunit alcohol dehydrogenase family)
MSRATSIDTLVWITGATRGLGAALAASVPYANARVINVSRSAAPGLDNVRCDLSDPNDWGQVEESFERELRAFRGSRAIFISNALYEGPYGFVGECDRQEYLRGCLANGVAPVYLANAFAGSCRPEFEAGVVMLSSASARVPMAGGSAYGFAKAGIEQWVRVVGTERERRGSGPWAFAVRPGMVLTPGFLYVTERSIEEFPAGVAAKLGMDKGEADDPDEVAIKIWDAICAPTPSGTVLKIGRVPSDLETV